MTREDKKKWLGRYRQLLFKWESLMNQSNELFEMIISAPCKRMDGMPFNPSSDKTGDTQYVKHLTLQTEADEVMVEALKVRKEIAVSIDQLEDLAHVEILTYKYLEGKNWAEIKDEMNYSYSWLYSLHNEALDMIYIETAE